MTSLVANELLTWERNYSYNVGFDLAMWSGKLGVEFDAFYNYIFDILGSNTGKPASMGGYYPTYINNNAQDVKGIDVKLTHRNHIGKDFQYGVTVNMTWAKDRWLRYQDSPNTPDYAKRTGKSRYMTMGFMADGLFQSEEEIDNSPVSYTHLDVYKRQLHHRAAALFGALAGQKIGKEKEFEDGEHDEQFDQNDGPERLAYSHAAEAVHIEPKHFFESLNCHCVCMFNQS